MSLETIATRTLDPVAALPSRERLRVNEIYTTIQGESSHAGRPCTMVRLTGCQMRCVWCDSEHSFYEGEWRSLDEILERVERYGCALVEITGGEPLLQPAVFPLMRRLCEAGFEVLLETGGGLDIADVDSRVRRILDVKCPASGEVENNRWSNLDCLTPRDEIKLVVADREDYEWARSQIRERRLHELCPVSVSPVSVSPVSVSPVSVGAASAARPDAPSAGLEPAELAAWILEDRLPVRLNLQLHKLLWGDEARGV